MTLTFRSDIVVVPRIVAGTDVDIATSAWASSKDNVSEDMLTEKRIKGLLNSLMRDRHGSPFDEGFLSVYIEAPRAVRDEHVRHRNLSYSSSSLRYTLATPEVYIPSRDRPLKKADGFKQIRPKYEVLSDYEYQRLEDSLVDAYTESYDRSNGFLELVDSTEAVRWITTDGHYVHYIARGMLRPWLQFLQLRTHEETSNHPSHPMWEIEQVARQVEAIIAEHWPLTYEAWNKNGRDI